MSALRTWALARQHLDILKARVVRLLEADADASRRVAYSHVAHEDVVRPHQRETRNLRVFAHVDVHILNDDRVVGGARGALALEEMRAADVLRRRVRLEEGVIAHLRRKRRLRCGLAVEVEAAHVGAVDEHRRAGVQEESTDQL